MQFVHNAPPAKLGRVTAFVLILMTACTVMGQVDIAPPEGMRDAFRADFNRRDLHLFEEHLGLRPEQIPLLETFYEEYEDQFAAGVERLRERMADARPKVRPEDPEIAAKRRDIQDRVAQLRRKLQDKATGIRDPEVLRELTQQYMDDLKPLMEEQSNLEQRNSNVHSVEDMEAMMQAMNTELVRWEREKSALADQFLANLQNVLLQEQQAKWPALQRLLRRQKLVPLGRLSGESLDVFSVLREMDIDPDEQVEAILSSYEMALDEALRARAEYERANREPLAEAMGKKDAVAVLNLVDGRIARHVAVRDVNARTVRAVADVLAVQDASNGTSSSEAFLYAANIRSFPRLYRTTKVQRLIDDALELGDLSEEARSAIAELQRAYQAQMRQRNEELRRITMEYEPRSIRLQYEQALETGSNNLMRGDDPVRRAMDDRSKWEEQIAGQLRAVLSPEQAERLPGLRMAAEGGTLMARFDKDGNGVLSADEREAMREHFRNGGE